MSKVICDTNVWYQLGKQGIHKIVPLLQEDTLYITQLSYFELISTENIYSHFDIVKAANIALQKHGHFLVENDMQHVLNALGIGFVECKGIDCREIICEVCQEITNAQSIKDLKYNYQEVSIGRQRTTHNIAEQLNKFIIANKKKHLTEDTFRHYVAFCLRRDTIAYIFRHRVILRHHPFRILSLKVYKETFSLYINVFAGFLYTVYGFQKKKEPMKVQPNDYIDFRNLIYCTGSYKYLTLERTSGNRIGGMLRKYGQSYVHKHSNTIRAKLNR